MAQNPFYWVTIDLWSQVPPLPHSTLIKHHSILAFHRVREAIAVGKIPESYGKMFGEKPKKTRTQLVAGDLRENDLSDFCDQEQIKQYKTIVGQLIGFLDWGDLTLQYMA